MRAFGDRSPLTPSAGLVRRQRGHGRCEPRAGPQEPPPTGRWPLQRQPSGPVRVRGQILQKLEVGLSHHPPFVNCGADRALPPAGSRAGCYRFENQNGGSVPPRCHAAVHLLLISDRYCSCPVPDEARGTSEARPPSASRFGLYFLKSAPAESEARRAHQRR